MSQQRSLGHPQLMDLFKGKSTKNLNQFIDDKVTRLNQETWLTDGPRHTKLTLGQKHAKIIKNLNTTLSNNRQDYRTAVHLITGHCGLNKHLHNIRKSNTSACHMCGDEEETVSHFLGQCPAIAQIRGQYFQDYYLSVNDIFDNQHDISGHHCQFRKPHQTFNCARRAGSDRSDVDYRSCAVSLHLTVPILAGT